MPRSKKKKVVDKDWIICPDIDFKDYDLTGPDELHARFWINCLYYRMIVSELAPSEWICIPKSHLAIFTGSSGPHIKRVREHMVDAGLIECDGIGVKGVKAYGYRLGSELIGVKRCKWAITDRKYVKRFLAFREHITRPMNLSPVGLKLRDRAMGLVRCADWDDVVAEVSTRKQGVQHIVDFLDNGWTEWSECDMGRFHSIFTRMPSELRQSFADRDGERLVEIDVVNSQPYYLLNLLADVQSNPEKYIERQVDPDVERKIIEARSRGEWIKHMQTYAPNANRESKSESEGEGTGMGDRKTETGNPGEGIDTNIGIVCVPSLGNDYQIFTQDVLSGRIYERWMEHTGIDDRGTAKRDLFKTLYGCSTVRMRQFGEVYPSVGSLVEWLKVRHGHWWIGRTLQRMESERIIQTACRRIVEERPELSILTCHDSIACPEHALSYINDVIARSHSDLEFSPKIRCKELGLCLN